MNRSLASLPLLTICICFLAAPLSRGVGNDNPTGVTGEYNGSITTGGSYDPYTGNATRTVEDINVTGAVGAYPLKWTRTLNTRQSLNTVGFGSAGAWTHNYHWSLWLRYYHPYHYYPDQYEGPDGGLTFPDGRTMELEVDPDNNFWQKTGEPLFSIEQIATDKYDVVLNDGGRVTFQVLTSGPGGANLRAASITDPHGIKTTFTHDASGRLSRITEQAGRYLQINYGVSYVWNGQTYYVGAIGSVQAFAREGQLVETVRYAYAAQPMAYDPRYRVLALTNAYYNEGTAEATQATYTYFPDDSMNGPAGGRIKTCQDVRYAGAMKNIAYEYMTGTSTKFVAVGQVKREKNFTTGQTISEVQYPDNYPNPAYNDDEGWKRVQRRHEVRPDGSIREFQYSGGELPEYTDFKNKRTYQGVGYGNWPGAPLTWNVTDARGNTTYREGPAFAPRSIKRGNHPPVRFTYGDQANSYGVTSRTDENGHTTHFDRDANDRIWRTRYPDGGIEEFTYNEFGQVLTHLTASGGTDTFTYDHRGLKTTSYPQATWSDPHPGNHPTYYFYYPSGPHTDRLARMVDPRGNETRYEYNGRGQVTKVTHHDGTYTQSGYNPDGTLAWTADENHPNASWNESERIRYTYDEYKRLLTVKNLMSETTTNNYAIDVNWAQPLLHTTNSIKYTLSPLGKTVVFDYDENFRKISQVSAPGTADEACTMFEYDEVGNLIKTTDPRFNVTTFEYDDRNRQVTVTDALNQVTRTEYDAAGNKISVTRPNNPPLQFTEYDPMNRLTRQIDEKGVLTRMEYNAAGSLIKSWDGNNNLYQYEYDVLNRRTVMVYPDNSWELTKYDEAGNKESYTNRAGAVQTFFYDNRNRALGFDWNDGYTPQQRTQYDAASRVTQVWNWDSTINFTYFDNNRLKTQQELTGSNYNHTISYAYDGDGNRQSITCPSGKVWLYAYNERNQLLRIMNTGFAELVTYQYDRAGNRERRSLFNGTVTDFAPADPLNRSAWVRHSFNGVETGRFDYAFDQLGRLKYEQRDGGAADGYGYDPTDQVTAFNRDGVLSNGSVTGGSQVAALTYDPAGNRAQVTSNGATTAWNVNNLNQYTSANGSSALSDVQGNLESYTGWTYTYDAQNRLRSAVKGGTSVEFWYDGFNRQITRRINGSAIIRSVWDGWNLLEERDGNDAPLAYYLHGAKTDELVVRWGSVYGEDTWYAQDGRGNVSHVYNYGGFVERYTYGLAGEPRILAPNGTQRDESLIANRFMFTGREYHKGLGIYDYRNRYYHPGLNRFLQTDPIGMQIQGAKLTAGQKAFYSPGGAAPEAFASSEFNLYRYCHNDPINKGDPMGLMSDGYTTSQEIQALRDDPKTPAIIIAAGVSVLAAPVAVEAGLAALAIPGAFVARAALSLAAADKLSVQFGRTANQLSHAFRHTDKLGLNRTEVQTAVRSHLSTVASQVKANEPLNKVIEIGGQKIQYTAYRLKDGTISVGRIHGL